jgi:hypothetical protein
MLAFVDVVELAGTAVKAREMGRWLFADPVPTATIERAASATTSERLKRRARTPVRRLLIEPYIGRTLGTRVTHSRGEDRGCPTAGGEFGGTLRLRQAE